VIHKLAEAKTKAAASSSVSDDSKPTAPLPRLKHAEKRE
jgi:hypothetical protein